MTEKRCIGMFALPGNKRAVQAMKEAEQLLINGGMETADFDSIQNGKKAEAIMVFGGDGTLLKAARIAAPLGIPVMGVNFGRVGYLCAVNENQVDQAVEKLISKQYRIDKHTRLKGRVCKDGKCVWKANALNEFLIGGSNRTVELDVKINGDTYAKVRGDGVIVCTKTGSTAYAFSAGGPVLLTDDLCLVASNAVFSTAIRSLVLPRESRIEISNKTARNNNPYVVADGQKDVILELGATLELSVSETPALLINLGIRSEVETLHRGFLEQMIRELGY